MSRGFTLIETLITTALLVSGLVGVASLFSYSVATNLHNQQLTAATLLLQHKMEELKFAPWNDGVWNESTGSEYVRIGSGGALAISTADRTAPYFRTWHITGTAPRVITVIVYARRTALTRRQTELARATTMVSTSF